NPVHAKRDAGHGKGRAGDPRGNGQGATRSPRGQADVVLVAGQSVCANATLTGATVTARLTPAPRLQHVDRICRECSGSRGSPFKEGLESLSASCSRSVAVVKFV